MPIDDLPGEMTVPTRDGERDRWRRDYTFHDPSSDTAEGSQPWVEGSTMADATMPMYHDIKLVADATDPTKIGGAFLDIQAGADGVLRPQAVGGSGSVTVSASLGGGTIQNTQELTANNMRFRCSVTALYNDGDQVPIIGIDTGPQTNLAAGTIMRWTSPPPGIAQDCIVTKQPDGKGLSGGRNEADDEEYRILWSQARQQRAASGNDTEIQQIAENVTLVPVQKCFTYPTILGPSSTAIAFTLKPDDSGSSRIPNPTQIATVLAAVVAAMPATEGIFSSAEVAVVTDVVMSIKWDESADGWLDIATWPDYFVAQKVIVQAATDALNFILKTGNSVYGITNPVPGQSIAFYDSTFAKFRRKTILSVTGTGPWTIVCDASNGVSDQSYIPVVNQRACPWSESLQNLVKPTQLMFQKIGPGEQVASLFDPGKRQRRQPPSPRVYPSVLTEKLFGATFDEDVPSVGDYKVLEPTLPASTPVGTPAATVYLLELGRVTAFPL